MKEITLGERVKNYESVSSRLLTKRVPVIIRIDGRSFHNVCKKVCKKGFDIDFARSMMEIAAQVQKTMSGCDIVYGQSDEMSFLLTDYRTIKTHAWFDYRVEKICSVAASVASGWFTKSYGLPVSFDARAFNVPQDDVSNVFLWRQQDASRNAIQMLGQQHFSHKQLQKKSCKDIQEMLFQEKGINFNDLPTVQKRGWCVVSGELDEEIPIFSESREYIEKFVYIRED